jgi:hypothetical protein
MAETKVTAKRTRTTKLPRGYVLVLRTCNADGTSHGGFVWPKSGLVKCPDWSPTKQCGNGLHGLLWGEGDGSLLSVADDARWQVVTVRAKDIVDLGGKVKFPRGVVWTGTRDAAVKRISAANPAARPFSGQATAGYRGQATAGYSGVSFARFDGRAKAGVNGAICISYRDGKRERFAIGYVGEDGIKPDAWYCVKDGKLSEVIE